MPIDLSKSAASPLGPFDIEAVGAGLRGMPFLTAVLLGDGDAVVAEVEAGGAWSSPSPDGCVRFDGTAVQGAQSREIMRVEPERIPAHVLAVAFCLSSGADSGQPHRDCVVRVAEVGARSEMARREMPPVQAGRMREFGRLERQGASWRYVATDRVHGQKRDQADHEAVTRLASRSARPQPVDPLSFIAEETVNGYCDASSRRAMVQRVRAGGMTGDMAQTAFDLELERLRVANEAVLLERLDALLHRFTADDRRLDDKERQDALQMVCRAEPGYSRGLRHDVADWRVTAFCREHGVKVKVGFLKWAVP